jgi:hypothetical protein
MQEALKVLPVDVLGFYIQLLFRYPDGAEISAEIVQDELGIGAAKFTKYMKVLKESGFLVMIPVRNETSRFLGWEWKIIVDAES